MKRLILLSAIALVLSATKAWAQDYVLEGTIGKFPVFMELKGSGYDLVGTYYYTRQGPTKRLRVEMRYDGHGGWKMKEYVGGKLNGTFTMGVPTFRLGDTWRGSYTNAERRTYNYALTVKSVAKDAVTHETWHIGNYPVHVEFFNVNVLNDSQIGNYYYDSQGPKKRLVIAAEGAGMSRSYLYDYLNGKKVGEFIFRSGYEPPVFEYYNAQGKRFNVRMK